MVKCSPEVQEEADGKFKTYFAVNKIIFDYLQAERGVELDSGVVQALGSLLDVKLEYNWVTLRWHENPDLPDNVIDKQPTSVIADLVSVMEHIITEGEEEAFQSETGYRNAQNEFLKFMRYAENWLKLEFISSILGMIALVAIILIAIFRSRIIESIILSLPVMDEYKFISPSQTSAKAFTLPPIHFDQEPIKFQPPTLPSEWGESKDTANKQKITAQFMAWVLSILIILTILAILYTIFKKCRYISALPRVCFPL